MKAVLLNNCDTGRKAANWDQAIEALKDYADDKFKDEFVGHCRWVDERRELTFARLLTKHELKAIPKLTAENSEETNEAFIIYL